MLGGSQREECVDVLDQRIEELGLNKDDYWWYGELRHLIRPKRGLCVACGYDIRHADHDACPECGVATASAMPIPLPR